MAVNATGAGGVPAGTIYAITKEVGQPVRIARFNPNEELSEVWEVTALEGPYERCGKDGEPAHPECEPRSEGEPRALDVDVDQSTGNVYVYNGAETAGKLGIVEYSADGSKVISRFGEIAPGSAKLPASAAQIHRTNAGGIAVNSSGEVYVTDIVDSEQYRRLMVFAPKTPGDYGEYEYKREIAGGFVGKSNLPGDPVADSAGNIYVTNETMLEKFTPAGGKICQFEFKSGGVTAITVNQETGEPVFFSYKKPKLIHELSACEGGEFNETGTIEVKPERDDLWGLAYDPNRKFSPGRSPGVLYGGAPGPTPTSGVGKGEPGQTALGYSFAPSAESPPTVVVELVSKVTPTTAELKAKINPKNFKTSYAFQYISESAYIEAGESFTGATEVPLGGVVLGSGEAAIAAAASLSGLTPDTGYHYRVVATSHCSPKESSKICEVQGPDQFLRTYLVGAAGLPDERGYELVSPPQKNGGQVLPAEPVISSCNPVECKPGAAYQHFPMQSSPDGELIVYEGSPFFPGQGAVIENEYISRRGVAGWGTTNLTPRPLASKGGQGYKAFDPSLARGVLEQISPSLSPDSPNGYADLFLQPSGEAANLTPLLRDVPAPPNPNHRPFNRLAGEGSGSLKVFYAGASADLSRLFFAANDALTEATPSAPEALDGGAGKNNLYEWAAGQLSLVNVEPGNAETSVGATFGSAGSGTSHAISNDGTHVYWSSESDQLYARIDGKETLKVEHPGKFVTASADGSKVLLSDGCLYALELEACEDLTGGGGGFLGVTGQSADLSHLYFVDTAVLTEQENTQHAKAHPGKDNLYAWNEGAVRFVATLLASDGAAWQVTLGLRAEASPDGRWLTFLSSAPLTGFDNIGPCKGIGEETTDAPCSEAFLYDSVTGALICVSCAPTNERPLGRTVLRVIKGAPAALPQPRYLTNSGRLYFDTQNSLSPADTNGNVEDVYQFEPGEQGTCNQAGGCVSLISSGRGAVDSNFLAIDERGENVFFTSRDQLVPTDTDELIDLYDARVKGGFADESELPSNGCGEGCQPSTSTQPEPPPSTRSTGSGNFVVKGCKKGQVKKKGRCVNKPKQKRHKAMRTSHVRGGAK